MTHTRAPHIQARSRGICCLSACELAGAWSWGVLFLVTWMKKAGTRS